MTSQSALVLGATGATGKHLLKQLIESPHFTKVGEYGRRTTAIDSLPAAAKEKLEQKTIDFEKLELAELAHGKWDVVFITLGTTRAAAGSAAAFEKIDREYVINAAKAAKVEGANQRLVYLSSSGANAKSSMLYMRSKGLTEQGLAALGYSDTIIFEPGFLQDAKRPGSRILESAFGGLADLAARVSDSVGIPVPLLATAMIKAGRLGSSGLPAAAGIYPAGADGSHYNIIGNKGAIALGRADV